MGVEGIVNQTLIRRENLDLNQYTISLLKEAFRVGIVNKQMIDSFQAQIIFILKELIIRYTQGESTSVTVETAGKILNSIYYCIDAYTSSFNNPEDCITMLKEKNIKEIYEQGVKLIRLCVKETKLLYEKIEKEKLDIPLEIYNDTIDEALPDFFKKYEVVFNAHNTMSSMDYPLVFDNMNIRGIFYIKQYLEKLKIETLFCILFDKDDVLKILINYGKVYCIDYIESPINLFEILINNSIFSVLLGNHADRLILSKFQYELLKEKFSNLDSSKIYFLVNEAIQKIIENLCIDQLDLIDYIQQYKTVFMPRILNAVENGNLNYIVITDYEENLQDSSVAFEEGDKMKDESFRFVVHKIMECVNTTDKINIITSNIHSLEDFIDVLKADCLFGDEFVAVFNILSDMELSILGRIVLCEELRSGPLNLSPQVISGKRIEKVMDWHVQYIRYLQRLSDERIKLIERFINGGSISYSNNQ